MERYVDSSDGVRIAVYEQGNPDGPTLVLVHGWPNSHVMWDGVVALLADRFRIFGLGMLDEEQHETLFGLLREVRVGARDFHA